MGFFRAKLEIFFQNSTLGYMTKTLNQIKTNFLHRNQNIFLEKKHNTPPPPPEVKWSVPKRICTNRGVGTAHQS
jgi:hypothetical protein